MRFIDLEKNAECRPVAPAAVALGNFDGVHRGHRAVIDALGDDLPRTVLTFSDLRKSDLICTFEERLSLFRACGVRYAIVADFDGVRDTSPEAFVSLLCGEYGARRLACGESFTFGAHGAATAHDLCRLAAPCGAEAIVARTETVGELAVSSTEIRRQLRLGRMDVVRLLLGRYYGFELPVSAGRGVGRTLGFPTVNQRFAAELCAPAFGVYASRCAIGAKIFDSVTNLGVRPTYFEDGEVVAETHIFDFSGDLTGRTLRVELCSLLRPERRFESEEALCEQIALDVKEAKSFAR